MRLYRKKTLTKMELVCHSRAASLAAVEIGWITAIGPEFETVYRNHLTEKRLIIARDHCIVFTQGGAVTAKYPFWLAIDQKGFGYPITPEEHAITYEVADADDN